MDQTSAKSFDFERSDPPVIIIKTEPLDFDDDEIDDYKKNDAPAVDESQIEIEGSKHSKTKKSTSLSTRKKKQNKNKKERSSSPTSTFCSLCQKSFATKRNLKHHHGLVHLHAPIDCSQCGKTFKNQTLLKVHVRRRHGGDPEAIEARRLKDKLRKQEFRAKARAAAGLPPPPPRNSKRQEEETVTVTGTDSILSNLLRKTPICRLCNNKSFATMKSLAQHIKAIHNNATTNNNNDDEGSAVEFECEICGKKSKNKDALRKHISRVHRGGDNKVSKIKTEPPTLDNNSNDATVIVANSNLGIPNCQLCHKEFANNDNLKSHLKYTHTHEPMICNLCGKTTNNRWKIQHHLRKVHGIVNKPKSDPLEPLPPAVVERRRKRQLYKQAARERARAKATGETWNPGSSGILHKYIPCVICRDKFASKAELKSHELTVHGADTTCPICNKATPNLVRLKIHVSAVHNQAARNAPIICDHCGLLFKYNDTLVAHMRRVRRLAANNGLTPPPKQYYTCSTCQMEFPSQDKLRTHARKHEPDEGTRYSCQLCSYQGRWKQNLTAHIHRVHDPQSESNQPYICTQCGKSFKYHQYLVIHEKIHRKNEVWTCLFCDKTFTTNSTRRQHERLRHPKPPDGYSCSECESNNQEEKAIFKSPALLERHTKLHHPHLLKNNIQITRISRSLRKLDNISIYNTAQNNSIKINGIEGGEPLTEVNQWSIFDTDVFGQQQPPIKNNANAVDDPANKFIEEVVDPYTGLCNNNNVDSMDNDTNNAANDDGDDWFGGGFDDDGLEASSFSPPTAPEKLCQVKLDVDLDSNRNDDILNQKEVRLHAKLHIPPLNPEIDTAKYSSDPKLCNSVPIVKATKFVPIPNRPGRLYCALCTVNFGIRKYLSSHMKTFHGIDNCTAYAAVKIGVKKKRKSANGKNKDKRSREHETESESESSNSDTNTNTVTAPIGKSTSTRRRRSIRLHGQTKRKPKTDSDEDEDEEEKTSEETNNKSMAEHSNDDDDNDAQVSTDSDSSTAAASESEIIKNTIDKLEKKLKHLKNRKIELSQKKKKSKAVLKQTKKHESRQPADKSNISHSCSYCSKSFKDAGRLKIHVDWMHEKATFANTNLSCPTCHKAFDYYSNLTRHIALYHVYAPVSCLTCKKTLPNILRLNAHRRQTHPTKRFQCKQCERSFRTSDVLWYHVKNVHKKLHILCTQCPYIGGNQKVFERHMENRHGEKSPGGDEPLFTCSTCGKTYKNVKVFQSHLRSHRTDYNYKCLFCAACFNTSVKKRKHEARYHGSNQELGCRGCEKICPNAAKLEQHVIDKHSKAELDRLYYEPATAIPSPAPPRPNANRGGTYVLEPEQLLLTSTGTGESCSLAGAEDAKSSTSRYYSKPVQCSYCSLLCKNRACRVKHVKLMHPETLIRNCIDCGQEFKNAELLRNHRQTHHGVKPVVTCPICRVVVSKRGYGLHYESHGIPIPCELCGKGYKNRDRLRDHVRAVHIGRKRPGSGSGLLRQGQQKIFLTPEMHQQQQYQPPLPLEQQRISNNSYNINMNMGY